MYKWKRKNHDIISNRLCIDGYRDDIENSQEKADG